MTTAEINECTQRLEELERLHLLPDETLHELRKWWTATVRREKNKVVSIDEYRRRNN